jgi:DNA-binding MarR family transcriptional regulator
LSTPPDRDELAARLRLAIGRLHRRMARQAVEGLTPSQLSALALIEQTGPVRVTEVAAKEGVAPPSMTRIIASLDSLGLLDRRPDPADGRAWLLVVSQSGNQLLQRVRGERTAYLARQLAALDENGLAALEAALPVLEEMVKDGAQVTPPGRNSS